MIEKLVVDVAGLILIAAIVWFFWGPRRGGFRAPLSSSGYQEAMILVKGGYSPSTIVVKAGKPVRLTFQREESTACSEMVVFGDFDKSAKLSQGEQVAIELMPETAGTFGFNCQMGMLHGQLVVEE